MYFKNSPISRIARLSSFLTLSTLVLTACTNKVGDRDKADMVCPQVGVLEELSTVEFYQKATPEQKLPKNLLASAGIIDFKGDCLYKKKGVDVNFDLTILAEKGPKLTSDKVKLKYFVAITNPSREIMEKAVYETEINFGKDHHKAGTVENLVQFIPLMPDEGAGEYEVLVGFQPDDALIKANQELNNSTATPKKEK